MKPSSLITNITLGTPCLYPCRQSISRPNDNELFSKKIENALNEGEIDGIKLGLRRAITLWSPYRDNLSKSDMLKIGYRVLGNSVFKTWSCYSNKKFHCGKCESCNNRKLAFEVAKIKDRTKYLNLVN